CWPSGPSAAASRPRTPTAWWSTASSCAIRRGWPPTSRACRCGSEETRRSSVHSRQSGVGGGYNPRFAMNEGPELPAWARPRPPEGRPTWVMVLALAMLFVGGRFAATAVLELRDPYHPQPFPGAAFSAHLSEDIAALNAAMAKSYQQHAVAVRVNLASRLLVGLLMLLAAAAVFTSNLQARLVAIVAAYAAIAQ